MSKTIELSEESEAIIASQAAANGMSIDAWVRALTDNEAKRTATQAAFDRMLEIRKRSKPDPDGLTIVDYIRMGRR